MINIKLPDGTTREFPAGSTAFDVAASIGKRLAKDAVAAKVDGKTVELNRELPDGQESELAILTTRDREALDVMRHSAAHVMARAVMRLFPGVQLAFGPTIENGFYYDLDLPEPLSEEDFPKIEKEMAKIIKEAEPFERFELPTEEARKFCDELEQGFKVEHIDDKLKDDAALSFYRQGEFVDLCRGPHIPSPSKIGAFKLLSIAGAYWKNDASRSQLQRLYGTAWFSNKDLDAYLKRLEEAKKRDHRVLGKQLQLFTITQDVGPGLILWMPKGATVRGLLETFIRDELLKRGYEPVYTPNIGKLDLYRTSGHFPYYRDSQYPPIYFHPAALAIDMASTENCDELMREHVPGFAEAASDEEREKAQLTFIHDLARTFKMALPSGPLEVQKTALKKWLERQEGYLARPMNCPHHIQIYKAVPRSYRDLPVRLAEFGTVYRFEQTGELSGMTRVRGFTQDDAHLFCTAEQVSEEYRQCIELTQFVLKTLGLNDYRVRLGFRDKDGSKYVGTAEQWNKAEAAIREVAESMDLPRLDIETGEAAFYGPKADFVVRDCLGREWQLGTVQLDYNLPERFELEYVGADNKTHRPVMIHRAPLGSMERFIGILIEHFGGAFPLWIAPEQVRVLAISDKFGDYAKQVHSQLLARGFRSQIDLAAEKIGHKIRAAQLAKIPYMFVVGEKEQNEGTVAVRDRIDGDLGAMSIEEAFARLRSENDEKTVRQVEQFMSAGWDDAKVSHEY